MLRTMRFGSDGSSSELSISFRSGSGSDRIFPAKKSVRFGRTHVKKIESRKVMSEEERLGLWYSVKENNEIKDASDLEGSQVKVEQPHLISGITKTFNTAAKLAHSAGDSAQLTALLNKQEKLLEYGESLRDWVLQAQSFRGLEGKASHQHEKERQRIARVSREVVIESYQTMTMNCDEGGSAVAKKLKRKKKARAKDVKLLTPEEEEELANQYEEISRTSIIYARVMALMDHIASQETCTEDKD